jgi:type I restriction-modification system DNA methylase subunit
LDENELLEFDDIKIITKFWRIAKNLKGDMSIHDYEDYFIGLIFYKIISEV